jgi:homoserine O-acetyltransferase/O-succinyltransferase
MTVTTEFVTLASPLLLDSGRKLADVTIAYESYGDPSSEVVLVCHALSGDAHAAGVTAGVQGAGETDVQGLGWWDAAIGSGRALDTDRWRVICTNLVGGCRGSTGPASTDPATGSPYGSTFPELTVADLVRAQRQFLDALGLDRIRAAVGASLGGMQAVQLALDCPDVVDGVIAIASTARLDAQGVALNAIARKAITSDPDFQGGDYYGSGRAPRAGLELARQIGHVTYLSKEALGAKAGTDRLRVEDYLEHQGAKFADRFDANTYLRFSRALTRFELSDDQLARIEAPVLVVSFSSDWLYPPEDSARLASALPHASHVELDTAHGHDSFLLDVDLQAPHVRAFLDRLSEEQR